MVLNFGKSMLFQDGGVFDSSPEDGQVSTYEGGRIIPTDATPSIVTLTPLESALNILELQAAASIVPGSYYGLELDVFTDSTGYLNTVSTGSTTSTFTTNKYHNTGATEGFANGASDTTTSSTTTTITAKLIGYISGVHLSLNPNPTGNYTCSIIQNSVTLATKTQNQTSNYNCSFGFASGDYSSLIQPGTFTLQVTKNSGSTFIKTNSYNFSGTSITILSQDITSSPCSYVYANQNAVVQTNVQNIEPGFTNFQVVAFRPATSGTGNIDASISFNNGVTYQNNITVNQNHNISAVGSQMIVKLNLNAGNSAGLAETKGWGVQLW